jgi:hypothetical protein
MFWNRNEKKQVSESIQQETAGIIDNRQLQENSRELCSNGEGAEQLNKEVILQKLNALCFKYDYQYRHRKWFDADFLMSSISEGVLSSSRAKDNEFFVTKIFELAQIDKDEPDRLSVVYKQSIDRVMDSDKSINIDEVEEYLHSEVVRVLK